MTEISQEQVRKECQDKFIADIQWYANRISDIRESGDEYKLDFLLFFLNKNVPRLQERRQFWKDHPI